jgi:hypothetical protein
VDGTRGAVGGVGTVTRPRERAASEGETVTDQHPSTPSGAPASLQKAPSPAPYAAPAPGPAPAPAPAHGRRGAGTWIGLVLLAALACLFAWWLSPFVARVARLDSGLGPRALVFGVTPTSFALGTGPFLNILLLGVAAAALVTRRAWGAVAATGLALLLGCVGHLLAAAMVSGTVRPAPVLVGLLLSALVVLPAAALAGLLARTSWGRLVVVAAVLAPTLLVVLQQVVFVAGGPAVYSRIPSLVVLGSVVALVTAVAVGGGSGRVAGSAVRLPAALVLLLVAGALLPLVSLGLLALVAEILPRQLGGGMPGPTPPRLDDVLLPFQAMRVTWPAWVGGLLVGAAVGAGVLAVRRASHRSPTAPAARVP